MSTIAERFAAYRASGATRKQPIVVAPAPKPPYPHSGWLSNDETRNQRLDRLIEASLKYELSISDKAWMHRAGHSGMMLRWELVHTMRAKVAKSERRMAYYVSQPLPLGHAYSRG